MFAEAPWVDVLVHGEGELRFVELLRSFLHDGEGSRRSTGSATGRGPVTIGEVVTTKPADRIADLATVPSPLSVYSGRRTRGHDPCWCTRPTGAAPTAARSATGAGRPTPRSASSRWNAIEADLDRIIRLRRSAHDARTRGRELRHPPRDVEIAQMLVDTCHRYGKKPDFFVTWAKNSNKRIVEIAATAARRRPAGARSRCPRSPSAPTSLELAQPLQHPGGPLPQAPGAVPRPRHPHLHRPHLGHARRDVRELPEPASRRC